MLPAGSQGGSRTVHAPPDTNGQGYRAHHDWRAHAFVAIAAGAMLLGLHGCIDDYPDSAPSSFVDVSGPAIILGLLDRSIVESSVRRHKGALHSCYHTQLTNTPKVQGEATVNFVVAVDGSVNNVRLKSTALLNPTLKRCVIQQFEAMTFPAPDAGIVVISYPLVFGLQ